MSVINNNLLLTAPAASATGVSRSLRFNGSVDSSYLSRTPASASNRRTWTWAGWVKRSALGSNQRIFSNANSSNTQGFYFEVTASDVFDIYDYSNPTLYWELTTSQVFRDISAWYHILLAFDTTQATAANRVKLYVNGAQVTIFSTANYPSQNYDGYWNSLVSGNETHAIGRTGALASSYFNGYLADIYFIDGQALDPSSFTTTDATTGQLIPKAFSGTYGTNGFHLTFEDNSSNTATTLGKDTSGNGNNWTPNNLSVTAGAGNDSLVDVPTNGAQTDTGVGGEVRGNYCTWNPLAISSTSSTFANGNLDITTPNSGGGNVFGTFAIPSSGKWYWEVVSTSGSNAMIGISPYSPTANYQSVTGAIFYYQDGRKFISGSGSSYGTSYTTNDVIGIAVDADAGTITFYKNNASQGAISGAVAGLFPSLTDGSGADGNSLVTNFGQRPFAYMAPSGFKALNTSSLPAPLVTKPNTVMDVKLYTGNGSTQTISGLGFSPDLVWIKSRSFAEDSRVIDTVRGATNAIFTSLTTAEIVQSTGLTAFTSDGFTLGGFSAYNQNNSTFVAWTWDAGTSTVTNTQGSITSSVRANATAGFSVVTYTGSGANSTIGHGLGVAPQLIITKSRSSSFNWGVYHASAGNTVYGKLNLTDAFSALAIWQNTTPTSSVFYVGNYNAANQQSDNYVAYCFAPVVGYSSMGSYVGNGSSDGVFVYTGMRPRWIMTKPSSSDGAWLIHDTSRDPYNVSNLELQANASSAEYNTSGAGAGDRYDILSNGFKHRTGNAGANGSGTTYIYVAFSESPFNYARAR